MTRTRGRTSRARRVAGAGIADQDGLLLHGMAALAVGGARIDRVLEVNAFADGVALDDLVAHFRIDWGPEEVSDVMASRIGCIDKERRQGRETSPDIKVGRGERKNATTDCND